MPNLIFAAGHRSALAAVISPARAAALLLEHTGWTDLGLEVGPPRYTVEDTTPGEQDFNREQVEVAAREAQPAEL